MRPHHFTCLVCVGFVFGAAAAAPSVELPEHYFKLMEAELKTLQADNLKSNPGAMMAAVVLYTKKHPANSSPRNPADREMRLRGCG